MPPPVHRAVLAVLLALGLLVAPLASGRAEQRQQPSAEALAAARELLDASGAVKQFDAIMPLMMTQFRQAFIKLKPDQGKVIADVFDELGKRALVRKHELIDEIAVLYASKFPAEDLRQLTVFFRSGIGAKFVAMQPELIQQSMMIGQRWGERIGREVEGEARRELKKRGIDL